jgi:glycosyltransferase involved in cell wall biosynthesis
MSKSSGIARPNDDRLRVMMDISMLGRGMIQPIAKTGIHRVVESLAFELIQSQSLDIQFTAAMFPGPTFKYMSTRRLIGKKDLAVPKGKLLASLAFNRLVAAVVKGRYNSGLLDRARWLACLGGDTTIGKCWPPICQSSLDAARIFHFPFPFAPVPKQVRATRGLNVFVTAYDLIPILYPQYVGGMVKPRLERALKELRPDDWVLCISNSTRNDLLNYRKDLDPQRVIVTHLAASSQFRKIEEASELARVRKRYSIPDAPYFLSLCNLAPHKNLANVLKGFAMAAKQEKGENTTLVLAGPKGWRFEELRKNIQEAKGLEDRIIVTGYVEEEDLAALYSGAAAFVFMSRYEGFGLPCLEAMQCGLPTISSNTSSLPEVVGDAGIMLDPDDLNGLAHAMLEMIRNQELRRTLAEKASRRARCFSWSKCARETINAYATSVQGF